jgi:hypothetical protein
MEDLRRDPGERVAQCRATLQGRKERKSPGPKPTVSVDGHTRVQPRVKRNAFANQQVDVVSPFGEEADPSTGMDTLGVSEERQPQRRVGQHRGMIGPGLSTSLKGPSPRIRRHDATFDGG